MVEPLEKGNQVLRLRIEEQHFNGLVVSMTDESMMVATTQRELPELEPGVLVQGEMPRPDGLYVFATRLRGMQLAPVLVMILDRPKALRKVQRRNFPRYPVEMAARVIFISSELSLNMAVEVTDLSVRGAGLDAAQAVPVGYHCILLLRLDAYELGIVCRVIHSQGEAGRYHMGVAFMEMSRDDQDLLHELILSIEAGDEER